ncbi:MAG: hypothetical protein AAF401_09670, partial [Pseudomonadota bacterium]
MTFTDYGIFARYSPAEPILDDALHCRNEAGADFYDLALTEDLESIDIIGFVADPETGLIIAADYPAAGVFPADGRFIAAPPTQEVLALLEEVGPETHRWNGEAVEPNVPDLDEYKAEARNQTAKIVAALGEIATSGVADAEVGSWTAKLAEARVVLEGGASAMLDAECLITGESVEDLAAEIVARADIYLELAAIMAGLRRKAAAGIEAAGDHAGVDIEI